MVQESPVFIVSLRWSKHPLIPDWDSADTLEKVLKPIAKHWVFQKESTNGTNFHYQGFVNLLNKERPKTLAKKLNNELLGVELSAASNAGRDALKKYAMKEDSRVEGPWSDQNIYTGSDLIVKLWPWQRQMLDKINGPVDPRKITWIYDAKGNSGKSEFCKYMYFHKQIVSVPHGDTSNILNLVFSMPAQRAYLFDLSRSRSSKISAVDTYSAIEQIKNGYVVNWKFKTGVKIFAKPHVIVFSNEEPQWDLLSADRWDVLRMEGDSLVPHKRYPDIPMKLVLFDD